MDKNNMEDYYNQIIELTKDTPEMDERVEFLLLSLIERVQNGVQTNASLIATTAETLNSILGIVQNHKHCPICGNMYVNIPSCGCKR